MNIRRPVAMLSLATLLAVALGGCATGFSRESVTAPPFAEWVKKPLPSLELLSIDSLALRPYSARFEAVEKLPDGSMMLAYHSDGLRVFARLLIPSGSAPATGHPIVVYSHGWVGLEGSKIFRFLDGKESAEQTLVNGLRDAGFAVLVVGFRGHGRAAGRDAEGREEIVRWDNSSYLSPVFYAIDVLNALAGIDSLNDLGRPAQSGDTVTRLINQKHVFLSGHSQGGDVALMAMAVSNSHPTLRHRFLGGSIWSGCFGPRFEQLELYSPMASSPEAFLSGDGRWRASRQSPDGRSNPDFRFGYPPDWIGEPDPTNWSWQKDTWKTPLVYTVLAERYAQLREVLAKELVGPAFIDSTLFQDGAGRTQARHDPALEAAMKKVGAYHAPRRLLRPLNLHFSDRDYYSPPDWNVRLAAQVNALGGSASAFLYPGNTHSLGVSNHLWFSPPGTTPGLPTMFKRDVELFRSLVETSGTSR